MTTCKGLLFITFFAFCLTLQMKAQSNSKTTWCGFSVNASIPVGGFADVSPTNAGCGNTGFGGDLYAVHDFRNNVKLFSSLNINVNAAKKGALISKLGTSYFQSTQYITTNLITGPCMKVGTIFKTDIIPFAQAGLQMLVTPKTTISLETSSITRGPDVGYCFVYAIGCMFNMPVGNISLRYIKGRPGITEHYQVPGHSEQTLDAVTVKTDMIQVLVGVNF
jgi:hypothetical protein